MAVSKRVVFNRSTLDAVLLGSLDGLFELAQEVVLSAAKRAPDSPYEPYPTGKGLPQQGGALGYAAGKKINGWSQLGLQPKKPRGLREASKSGFLVVGGFGFPAHFAEFGTIHEHARPFLTPALLEKVPDAAIAISRGVRKRLASAGERAAISAAIAERTA
jgi:hypothetical protein